MDYKLYKDNKNDILANIINLKLEIIRNVFLPKLEFEVNHNEKTVLLLNTKKGFKLRDANTIVRYFTKNFERSKTISEEENFIYMIEKNREKSFDELKNLFLKNISTELNAENIILFSTLFFFSSEIDDEKVRIWINKFSEIEKVKESIQLFQKDITGSINQDNIKKEQKVKDGFFFHKNKGYINVKKNQKNILITSALPYVNNVPHLGNLIGSTLSADVFSRYSKRSGYNTLFICGTDEYGTATETKALKENVTPQELCDKYHKLHKESYDWFQIEFDHFGRSTNLYQKEIAQAIFTKLNENGFLEFKTTNQLYCDKHKSFLADRYVEGVCIHCKYENARGDQCDKCGSLLDPLELENPRCSLDNEKPIIKTSENIFLKLNDLESLLYEWFYSELNEKKWDKITVDITNSWIKKGLHSRCITRDLKWGTPVPLEQFKDKVFYVWFDAPIAYISITADYFKNDSPDTWKQWWMNPENVELIQFMGKDNVSFHSVVFPSSLLGTGQNWTMASSLSVTEYLNYENEKFSKSKGIGVFGDNVQNSGIPPSVWRYYLLSIRPETSDSKFFWDDLIAKNNNELLSNLGNFVNRVVKFLHSNYKGVLPDFDPSIVNNFHTLQTDVSSSASMYISAMEKRNLRRSLELVMTMSSIGNLFLQENKLDNFLFKSNRKLANAVISIGLNLIYFLSPFIYPYMPEISQKIESMLNVPPIVIHSELVLLIEPGHMINAQEYLFKKIEKEKAQALKSIYSHS